ncbi:MAG: PilN domain-containing protein [Candidatus Omnitrophica bacterium]|nr:PilN domain-containing protein [Candidatus Omnitrophota bacterium]MCK5392747.1 PilN domain-containing protein [Candidatus Omnitrophota bacterium]
MVKILNKKDFSNGFSKIIINLNPKKEQSSGSFSQKLISFTPLVILSNICIFIVLLLLQFFIISQIRSVNITNNKWKEWEIKSNAINLIKSDINNLQKEKIKLENVVNPKNDTALILDEIYASLPKNIWFNKLSFTEENMVIKGFVVKWQEDYLVSVDKFINNLINKEYSKSKFEKVNMTGSNQIKFNGIEVLEFSVKCKK